MTRKMFTAAIAVVALVMGVFALGSTGASAQCGYDLVYGYPSNCATPLADPGPYTAMPPSSQVGLGFGLNPTAASADAGAGAGAGGGAGAAGGSAAAGGGALAVTGSEAQVLGYVGTGLIAFGAVALGSRRKFFQGTLND